MSAEATENPTPVPETAEVAETTAPDEAEQEKTETEADVAAENVDEEAPNPDGENATEDNVEKEAPEENDGSGEEKPTEGGDGDEANADQERGDGEAEVKKEGEGGDETTTEQEEKEGGQEDEEGKTEEQGGEETDKVDGEEKDETEKVEGGQEDGEKDEEAHDIIDDVAAENAEDTLEPTEKKTKPKKAQEDALIEEDEEVEESATKKSEDLGGSPEPKQEQPRRLFGFDDDEEEEKAEEGEVFEEEDEEEDLDEAQPLFTRAQLIERYRSEANERDKLRVSLQKFKDRLATYFREKKQAEGEESVAAAVSVTKQSNTEAEERYFRLLSQYAERRRAVEDRKEEIEKELEHFAERQEDAGNLFAGEYKLFRDKKMKTLSDAVSERTGRVVAASELENRWEVEDAQEKRYHEELLVFVKLRKRVNKMDSENKARDKLGDDHNMIDFEQLKIENHTYNEKIEERNDEISKLKKKITSTVEVLTHIKEKLAHIQVDNQSQRKLLEDLDDDSNQLRGVVTKMKQSRDKYKDEYKRMKGEAGLLDKKILLRNMEDVVDRRSELETSLKQLQQRHAEILLQTKNVSKKLEKATGANAKKKR